jgi:transcriptional regulator with XRE-family HTH domain
MNRALFIVGTNVRESRRRIHLSQNDLANACGLHRTYISDLERGMKNATTLTLVTIAKALRIPVSDLTRNIEFESEEPIKRASPSSGDKVTFYF